MVLSYDKDYYQLIIIMYIDYYTKKKVSGCYILSNSKFKSSYIEILESFKNFITNENTKIINIKIITSDFELGLIDAIKLVFKDIQRMDVYSIMLKILD